MSVDTPSGTALGEVVDLERYPIDNLGSAGGQALIARCRESLAVQGACQLPGFFLPEAVDRLIEETVAKEPDSYRTDDTHNVYFEPVPAEGDESDPLRLLEHSSKQTIAWDQVAPDSPLRVAYETEELTGFLGEALGMKSFHRFADPLGAASLMIFNEGDELGWHFDRSPFAVTVMLRPVTSGGEYQYHHNLRSEHDENHDGIRAALAGDQPGLITLAPEPGALTMFRGQHSLHRVTPVRAGGPRINAVLAYSQSPDDRMNTLTQKLFYGRTA